MVRVDDVVLPVPGARTPYRVFRPLQARERFDGVARVCLALDDARPSLVAALSVKTNPRAELMALARERGFFAEVISADELRWAVECGFSRDRTIYNGPQPLPDDLVADPPAIVFADSIEALIGNAGRAVGRVRGVRLRPSMLDSRFGVPVEEDHRLAEVVAATPDGTAVGVSFHARREDFGTANWRDVAADVVERAAALQARSGRTVVAFDPGGGWTPAELDATFEPDMRWLVAHVGTSLPSCTRIIVEPGQSVCTPSEVLIATIVEVRERATRRAVVIDAGYPEWPQMHTYPHPLFAEAAGQWVRIGSGADVLHGRTCLEYDRIKGLRFPPNIAVGDRILIADVGSYDRSTSFDFARGSVRSATQSE